MIKKLKLKMRKNNCRAKILADLELILSGAKNQESKKFMIFYKFKFIFIKIDLIHQVKEEEVVIEDTEDLVLGKNTI